MVLRPHDYKSEYRLGTVNSVAVPRTDLVTAAGPVTITYRLVDDQGDAADLTCDFSFSNGDQLDARFAKGVDPVAGVKRIEPPEAVLVPA